MKKIAFYLENASIASVNCSNILQGNPGIGGTQYMIIVVSYLLSQRNNGLEVKTFSNSEGTFPSQYRYSVVKNFSEAVECASKEGFDCLIFRHDAELITSGTLDNVNKNIKLVVWDHVFVCYWELDYYASNNQIYKIINVGREQADLYRDHKAFDKMLYIYNCLNLEGVHEIVQEHPFKDRKNIVTYVGSLVPFKGFHLLAKAWPSILKELPDAELYVIGSGKLYNKNSQLGPFGIADSLYEEQFMHYLCKDGKIISSVHFMGDMGVEKNRILLQTKVGVPNPSGITETFCISAVEMQALGAVVTTINYPGFIDTVKNVYLYKQITSLADSIIYLLKKGENDYDEAMDYFESNFSFEAVISKWEQFLKNGDLFRKDELYNKFYRLKWLKETKRKIGRNCPFIYRLPPIERILLFVERIFYGRITYIDS